MTTNALVIHVRFAPDGSVTDRRAPGRLSAQQWFDRLSNKYAMDFQALSGGRGVYRLGAAEVEALKAAALQ